MSEGKDLLFESSSQFDLSANPDNERDNEGNLNHKHVSFAQKKALLNFMIEHKELAMRDHANEVLWNNLTNILNYIHEGAVRSCESWKKTWKVWTTNVQRKKNDLSITLLDLQLLTFLDGVSEAENLKVALKTFLNDASLLTSAQLNSMRQTVPQIVEDNVLINLINHLQALEQKEVTSKSDIEITTNRLDELLTQKQVIEAEINYTVNKLDENENKVLGLRTEKTDVLNEIRNQIKPLYT